MKFTFRESHFNHTITSYRESFMVGSQEIKSILVKRVLREILELLVSLLRWCLAKTID